MWDEKFEQLVRRYLPFLPEDEALTEETDLREHGLDSMGVVELLVAIERRYDTQFERETLSLDTFANPRVLWGAVSGMAAAAA